MSVWMIPNLAGGLQIGQDARNWLGVEKENGADPLTPSSCCVSAGSGEDAACCETDSPCPPPPGLPPKPVPVGPGSMVGIIIGLPPLADNVEGLDMTCVQTGVTNAVPCGGATFYIPNTGVSYTFTTPGGPGKECDDGTSHTYDSGSTTVAGTVSPFAIYVGRH